MIKTFRYWWNIYEKKLLEMLKDGVDWVHCYRNWKNQNKQKRFIKFYYNKQPTKPKMDGFIVNLEIVKQTKQTMKKLFDYTKNPLKSTKNTLPIPLIWRNPTTTSETCITAWVNISKQFRIMKKHLEFGSNHFLPIILIWHHPTTTSDQCITAWVNMPKHFRIMKKHLQFDSNHFLPIILIWQDHTIT